MSKKAPFVPVVAVLNMKGGVGKTTVSAHVFRVLFSLQKVGTLLIDLDPQFNLTQTLFTRPNYDSLKKEGKTIAAVMEAQPNYNLFTIKTSAVAPPKPSEICRHLFRFPSMDPPQRLSIIPGDFSLVKYSLMDDNAKLNAVRERFLKFVDAAKSEYRMICIDCNPSSSFLTLCALQACSHIVVPVRPDRYSILGLEILSEFVDGVPSISPKPQLVVVLNCMPRKSKDKSIKAVEADLRAHSQFGTRTLGNVIYESSHLRAKADYTGFATDKRGPWTSVLKSELSTVADELAQKLGVKK